MTRRIAAWLATLWLLAGMVHAEDYLHFIHTPFPIPDHYRLVNDFCDILRVAPRVALEQRLQALERRNGTQIVFLSVPNTGAAGDAAYAESVFRQWNIGNNGQGNGILILIGQSSVEMRTGPGIAGAVPDVLLMRMHRNLMLPVQERDDMTDGIIAFIDGLIKASSGEQTMPTAFNYAQLLDDDAMPSAQRHAIIVLALVIAAYASWLVWRHRRRADKP